MRWLTEEAEKRSVWESLLQKYEHAVFVDFAYLDATAEAWELLVNDTNSGGIPCPFVIKGGQKILVTPFFNRYMEWVGESMDLEQVIRALKLRFSVADIQLKTSELIGNSKIHQAIPPEQLHLNSQAKRSLKKAACFRITQGLEIERLQQLISEELSHKIAGIDEQSLPKLVRLVKNYQTNGLVQWNAWKDEQWCGGLWLIENNDTVLYLKGTTKKEAKKDGAMYALMLEAIKFAHSQNKVFDFGGSNVENVRRFNQHFGGMDVSYAHLSWNNAPFWWKMIRNLKNTWKKR